MIKVGVIGATGYIGAELLRLLSGHDQAQLVVVTSRRVSGKAVSDIHPNLRQHIDQTFTEPDHRQMSQCDVVFFATPHGVAMTMAPPLLDAGVKVIDLGADFRIKDTNQWQREYGIKHACPDRVALAVYGLPEVNREQIKTANLVANPGCYPTAIQLGFLPLIESVRVDTGYLIADCKSGVSGAGRKASVDKLFCEITDNVKAYAVPGHRHLPEIVQGLADLTDQPIGLTFVPHLTPMIRGIHATLYARSLDRIDDIQGLYENRYANEEFVDVMPIGSHPDTRSVRSANVCRLAVHRVGQMIVVLSVIDNLVKGAAGQAIQNFNLMFDLPECMGIDYPGVLP